MDKYIKSTVFPIKFEMKFNLGHIYNLIVPKTIYKRAKYLIIYQSQNSS